MSGRRAHPNVYPNAASGLNRTEWNSKPHGLLWHDDGRAVVDHMRSHGLADDDCRFITFEPALSVVFRRDGLILTVTRGRGVEHLGARRVTAVGALRSRRTARRLLAVRQSLETAVERALAALDALDGDPDLEPDADDEDGHDAEPDDFHCAPAFDWREVEAWE